MNKLFRIFELTKDLVDDIRTRTYDAHFHDFEELILITQGSLEHYIDFKVEVVQAPGACYVSMNKISVGGSLIIRLNLSRIRT
jgi:hypothetical protein